MIMDDKIKLYRPSDADLNWFIGLLKDRASHLFEQADEYSASGYYSSAEENVINGEYILLLAKELKTEYGL